MEGIPASPNWHRILLGTLAQCQGSQCQGRLSLCSPSCRESECHTAEVAFARGRGKTAFPLQVGKTELPLVLSDSQAIGLVDLIVLTAEACGASII